MPCRKAQIATRFRKSRRGFARLRCAFKMSRHCAGKVRDAKPEQRPGGQKDSLCWGHANRDTSRLCVSCQSPASKLGEVMGHSRKNGTLRESAPAGNPNVSRHRIDSLALGGRYSLLGKRGYSLRVQANTPMIISIITDQPTNHSMRQNCGQNIYAAPGAAISTHHQARACSLSVTVSVPSAFQRRAGHHSLPPSMATNSSESKRLISS